MASQIPDIKVVDETSYPYIFEQHVSVPLKNGGRLRCNVYRPKSSDPAQKYPVLVTCGPYGKDVPYKIFHPGSFEQIDPAHQTEHSAWETPTPKYWTEHGYVVVRADEPGIGQSPGLLSVKSSATADAFCDTVEWASEQPWSSGKVGLLGVSYYAVTQWQVAARNPKGLAACVPWEGSSDSYNESVRHGGILSNAFFKWWFPRQVCSNQYGLPGKTARNWGLDTVDGDLSEEELTANRSGELEKMHLQRYRDNEYFTATNLNLEDVKVPILSVGNLGGIMLHLRGNVMGFYRAASEFKYLRFIAGRHDLPFYYPEEVEVQRSFLDAFLRGDDRVGWATKDAVLPVSLLLRKGNVGVNDPVAEKAFARRQENEWPLARTQYTKAYLTPDRDLLFEPPEAKYPTKVSYRATGEEPAADHVALETKAFDIKHSSKDAATTETKLADDKVWFQTAPFAEETEITGHIVAHLNVSVSQDQGETIPSDIDLFLSVRHISPTGEEINYTGSAGDAVPVSKGWLRVSMRKTNPQHRHHRSWQPYRDYYSTDMQPVIVNEVIPVDVEIWPTNVVVDAGGRLVLEVSSRDTPGTGFWGHTDPQDRPVNKFKGMNHIHFRPQQENYISLPIIPSQ